MNDQTKALRWIADFCRTKRLGTDDWFDLTEIEIMAREALARAAPPVDLLPLRTALNTGAGLTDPAVVHGFQVLLDQAEAAMRGGIP